MSMSDSRLVQDPICGKEVDTLRARAVGIFGGVTYYFCSAECKAKFVDPRQTPREPVAATVAPASKPKKDKSEKIELAPPSEPRVAAAAPAVDASSEALAANLDNESPPRGHGRLWLVIAVVMLLIATAVLSMTLK
jgi:YHS domain-containing protein